jgi:hypothetical protein
MDYQSLCQVNKFNIQNILRVISVNIIYNKRLRGVRIAGLDATGGWS